MTTALIDQYRHLHETSNYGDTGARKAHYMIPYICQLKPQSVIDYGCGQSALPDIIRKSGVPDVYRYDPAIPAYAERPSRMFDLLVSVDVLEHVPEDELHGVLSDMRALARHALLIIDIKPAKQFLPNGQNAHATIKPPAWWKDRLSGYYDYLEPFPFHRKRACFKTWPTPAYYRPVIWSHSRALRILRHVTAQRSPTHSK